MKHLQFNFQWGVGWLILVRFIQGLGEGPIVSFKSFNLFIKLNFISLGSVHACFIGQVDSAK